MPHALYLHSGLTQHRATARNDAERPPELRPDAAIVVGIGHPGDAVIHPAERQRDYTPPPPGGSARPQAGGADRLLDFIAREVQPRVAEAFAVDRQRQTISGHSFGGLCVLHKPFGNDELLAAVQVALQAPPAVNVQHC